MANNDRWASGRPAAALMQFLVLGLLACAPAFAGAGGPSVAVAPSAPAGALDTPAHLDDPQWSILERHADSFTLAEQAADAKRIATQKRIVVYQSKDFMENLLPALALVGPDHVGIGMDWDGGSDVRGLEDVTKLPRVTSRLLEKGYSAQDIQKIWGLNMLRVLAAAESHAKKTRGAGR